MKTSKPLDQVKNIGTVALTSFMFQQASKANPVDLLGSMFIIEGIGKRLAGYWGKLMQDQLQLNNSQVSFLPIMVQQMKIISTT